MRRLDERGECLRLIGGVHGQAVKILGEAGLDGVPALLEHETRHFVITRQDAFVDERLHRAAAAFSGLDLELSARGRPHDEVLQQAKRGDAGLELGVGGSIRVAPNVARRLAEFVKWDRLDHGTHSWLRARMRRSSTPLRLDQIEPPPLSIAPRLIVPPQSNMILRWLEQLLTGAIKANHHRQADDLGAWMGNQQSQFTDAKKR
jgi:hypothetical protein